VDVSNWKPYDLDSLIEEALSKMGFGTPTPIQQECLPAAIRDRRDVIGAAQTVWYLPLLALGGGGGLWGCYHIAVGFAPQSMQERHIVIKAALSPKP